MDVFNMLGYRKECVSGSSQTSSGSVVSDVSHSKDMRKPYLACPALPGTPLQTWLRGSCAPPYIGKQAGHVGPLCGYISEQLAKLDAGDQSLYTHRVLTASSERYFSSNLFADSLVGVGASFGSPKRVPASSIAQDGRLPASTRLSALKSAFPDTLPLPPASGLPSLFAGDPVNFSSRGGGGGRGEAGKTSGGGGADGGGNQSQADKKRRASKITITRRNRFGNQSNKNNGHMTSPLVKGGSLMQCLGNTRLACLLYKLDPDLYWRCAQEHFVSAAATFYHLEHMHGSEIAGNIVAAVLGIDEASYMDQHAAGPVSSDKRLWQTALCIIVPLMLPIREKLRPYVGQPLLEDADYRSVLVQLYRQAHRGSMWTEPASVSLPASSSAVNRIDVTGEEELAQISSYTSTTAGETDSGGANLPTRLQNDSFTPAVFSRILSSTPTDHLQHGSAGVYHKDLCDSRAFVTEMLRYLQNRVVNEDLQPERDRQVASLKAQIDMLEALANHYASNDGLSIQRTMPPPPKVTSAEGPIQPDSVLPHPDESGERPPPILWLPPNTPQNQRHMQRPSPIWGLSPPGLTNSSDTISRSSRNSLRMAYEITQPTSPRQPELHTPLYNMGIAHVDPRRLQKGQQQPLGAMTVLSSTQTSVPWAEFINPTMMEEIE